MTNTTTATEPASGRQPLSAGDDAMLRARYGEKAPPSMHVCLFRSG